MLWLLACRAIDAPASGDGSIWSMALRIEGIEVVYGPGSTARKVLHGVTTTFEPGQVTAIVGPNGAGKSTLIRVALGLLAPRSGRVTLDGTDVATLRGHQRARRLVYVPQRSDAAFAYRVRDLIGMGRYAAGEASTGEGEAAITRALAQVELADRANDSYGQLSAGQQQRVTLARALVQIELGLAAAKPRETVALLADEPISAMDPRHGLSALGLFRNIARAGAAVVVILHDLTLASRIADHAVVMSHDGHIAFDGAASTTLTAEKLGPVMGLELATVQLPGGGVLIGPAQPILPG